MIKVYSLHVKLFYLKQIHNFIHLHIKNNLIKTEPD